MPRKIVVILGLVHPYPPGLRERKKVETRAALAAAARRLTVERGFENVTVDEIAAAADVSPRTFNNYFHSKEAAVLAAVTDVILEICSRLEVQPDTDPLWDCLRTAVVSVLSENPPDRTRMAEMKLISHTPALLGHQLATMTQVEARIAAEVGRRTDTAPDRDLFPRLVASAVSAVLRASGIHWHTGDSAKSLAEVVSDAFDQLTRGLPPPGRVRPATPKRPTVRNLVQDPGVRP
jgi:AcrR family transcriptional regulator